MGPLRRAAALGHAHVIAVLTEFRSLGEWQPLCQGTAFLAESSAARQPRRTTASHQPRLPAVHFVTCGHVAQPHLFRALYALHGEGTVDFLSQLHVNDVRVRVRLTDDTGADLATFPARRNLYASSAVTDDTAVFHLGQDDEAHLLHLLRTHYADRLPEGNPCIPLDSHAPSSELPQQGPSDIGSVLAAASAGGAEVCLPTYTLLQGVRDAGVGVACDTLHSRYAEILGDLSERRGSTVRPEDHLGSRMVPMVHRGVVLEETRQHTAAWLQPDIISANSGAPLLTYQGGGGAPPRLLGMLCQQAQRGLALEDAVTPGVDNPALERGVALANHADSPPWVQFCVPAWKLCNFIRRVERSIVGSS